MEQITQIFTSNASSKKDAAIDIGTQIMQTVFGISLSGGEGWYMDKIKITIDVSSSSYQYIDWYINSTYSDFFGMTLKLDTNDTWYISVTWIQSTYLTKLGDLYIWKGKYSCANTNENNPYLMDLETNEEYSGSLKSLSAETGMVAIAPLYHKGRFIEDAYMCSCSGMNYKQIYYVGGKPFMYLPGSVLIALEP